MQHTPFRVRLFLVCKKSFTIALLAQHFSRVFLRPFVDYPAWPLSAHILQIKGGNYHHTSYGHTLVPASASFSEVCLCSLYGLNPPPPPTTPPPCLHVSSIPNHILLPLTHDLARSMASTPVQSGLLEALFFLLRSLKPSHEFISLPPSNLIIQSAALPLLQEPLVICWHQRVLNEL